MRRLILVLAIFIIAIFFWFDLSSYLNLEYVKSQQIALTDYVQQNPLRAAAIYFVSYIFLTSLSLPGASVFTLIGGALFGVLWGTVLVSFASTIGATLAFLLSRYLFRDAVTNKFQTSITAINEGIDREGAFYLFTVRLIPIFPYFLVNLLMGLTSIPLLVYALVSQIGMLPATIVYINAGTQLGKVEALGDIASLPLLLSFALLGIFPLAAKKLVDWYRARAVLRQFERPTQFDRNLVVIGAGSGGLVSAYIAAAVKADVTLIEKSEMGGDCLNTGCVPSKTLIRASKAAHAARRASDLGVNVGTIEVDFARVMARVREVISRIAPNDSVERYTELGVECVSGEARLIDPYRVRVGEREICTRNIILATGGRPFVPPIPGLENIDYLTSDNVWQLETLPKRLLVLGGGPIGCELSQAFCRLGSNVTIVEGLSQLLPREDSEVATLMQQRLEADGVSVFCGYKGIAVETVDGERRLHCEPSDEKNSSLDLAFDEMLIAVGRRANTENTGITELGIRLRKNGTIATDAFLRTNIPNIYACGDATGPYQFTHAASHQAWHATVNALFSGYKKFRVDYSIIPWATFTDPEIARVGLNETEAKAKNIQYEVTVFNLDELDRAITDAVDVGMVKVLTVPGKDKILGCTIVGEHAGDLICEFITAMKYGLGLGKILNTIHIYPTLAEANKFSAGAWRRAHQPAWALNLLQKFHRWRLR